MTQVSLVANAKDNIDLRLTPIKGGDSVTEASVLELIESSEYATLAVNTANIKNAIAELNDVLKPLQDKQSGREICYQALERKDATISVTIDKDEMGATAEIMPAQGGKNLSAKAILNAAQEAGVKKGFSKELLIKLARLAAKAKPNDQVNLQIATGKQAINGKDAVIKPLVESAQSRILRPKKREDGSVDMRDLGDIICVKVGDPLAKKIPLTTGKQGYTVTATPLSPEPGNDVELVPGEGTTISSANENILVSEKVGLPKLIANGMEVDEVYKIKDVTVATGNINFTGSVIIEGDVTEGMKVIASGDVTVGGFVESALVEAGGDVTISGGIIGRKHDVEETKVTDVKMSVSVNAKGSIYAKYAQYAQINCGKDVRIENQLLHSLLNINGQLKVGTEEQANGKLIGGYIKAGTRVSAGIVGATAGSNTIINFEHEIVKLKEQMHDIESRLKFDSAKTNELKAATNKLKKLPKDKAKPEMLAKVISTYQFHAKRLGEILLEKEAHEKATQDYMESVYIEATEKLYHGVELIVGDFHDRSRREYGPSKMIYKERKIHIDPIVNT
ncbi:MAG: FapA family protein [Colwellia sp.]|nr:FapA family protein [Colwellia sp.]MCW9080892.1 FapA family protein [Colwellia sp.]